MAFTNETIISIMEDFLDPGTEIAVILLCSEDGILVVVVVMDDVNGKGKKVAGVRSCGDTCCRCGRFPIVEEGYVFRSESHIPVLVVDGTNQGALLSASDSSTHWAWYRVFLLLPVLLPLFLLLPLEDDILGIARIEFLVVVIVVDDGDDTFTPSKA
jgi:hypothetical protein